MREEDLKFLEDLQDCPFVHPLTCGNNSRHRILVPQLEGEKLVLICKNCGYRQEMDDDFLRLLKRDFSKIIKEEKIFRQQKYTKKKKKK